MATVRQYHFVLSEEDDNSGLKAHMDKFAKDKKLTARIKTALTLLAQLENDNFEMLDSMFPKARPKSEPPPTPPKDDLQHMISEAVKVGVDEALQKLPALPAGRLVAEPAYKEPGVGISTMGQGKPSKLAAVKLDLPVIIDDDDLGETMVMTKIADDQKPMNGANLMAGLFDVMG